MTKFKQAVAVLALAGIVQAAPAQDRGQQGQVVQDGIAVKPLKGGVLRDVLAPEGAMDQQAAQQYTALLGQAQQKGVLVPAGDPQVKRLRAIAERIIPHTTRWNQDAQQWKWQVNLLKSDQVNAFCMPGGRIAFFTGIIDKLKLTDDEIAAVMGHEIAHALREHARERASQQVVANSAISIGAALLGLGDVGKQGGQYLYMGLMGLPNSRANETEADRIGVELAARGGYDPKAAVTLWQKMASLGGDEPMKFMSTHPSSSERIADLTVYAQRVEPLYQQTRKR